MTFAAILGVFMAMIQIISGSTPKQQGRVGNDHLKQEEYEEAATAYQDGLSTYQPSEGTDQTYYGLQNNLGLSLHRQENFEEAGRAFEEALSYAPDSDATTRAAFNAGNNAFTSQQLERALQHYQAALMADPDNEDAKFNFEFVTRQLQEQQEQEQQKQDSEDEEQEENEQDQEGEQNNEQNEEQQGERDEDLDQNDQGQTEEEQTEKEPEQSGGQDEPNETPLTREQAERILEALANEEEQLLREVQKMEGRPRRVAKDW